MGRIRFVRRIPINMPEWLVTAIVTCMGTISIAVGIYAFFDAKGIADEDRLLEERGTKVQGTVVGRRRSELEGGSNDEQRRKYYLRVRYHPSLTKEFEVPFPYYVFTANDSAVEVVYDPKNPGLAKLTGAMRTGTPAESIFAGILFIVVGVGAIGYLVWQRNQPIETDAPSLDEALEEAKRG